VFLSKHRADSFFLVAAFPPLPVTFPATRLMHRSTQATFALFRSLLAKKCFPFLSEKPEKAFLTKHLGDFSIKIRSKQNKNVQTQFEVRTFF